MVTYTERFAAGPQDTDVTRANAPGLSLLAINGGSTIKYDAGMAGGAAFGAKVVTTTAGTNFLLARCSYPSPVILASSSVVFTVPATNPSANTTIFGAFTVTGAAIFLLIWTPQGALLQRRTAGNSTTENVIAAAGVIPNGKKCRFVIALNVDTSGGFTVKVYDGQSTTKLVADKIVASGYDLGTTGVSFWDAGVISNVATSTTLGFADLQIADIYGELPALGAPPSTTSVPEAITSNPGGWTNEGGAASLQAALADASDTTFIQSPGTVNNEIVTVDMGSLAAGDVRVRIRMRNIVAGPVKVELLEGTTVRATFTQATVTTTMTDYIFTLTAAQNAAIVDRTALFVRITSRPA